LSKNCGVALIVRLLWHYYSRTLRSIHQYNLSKKSSIWNVFSWPELF